MQLVDVHSFHARRKVRSLNASLFIIHYCILATILENLPFCIWKQRRCTLSMHMVSQHLCFHFMCILLFVKRKLLLFSKLEDLGLTPIFMLVSFPIWLKASEIFLQSNSIMHCCILLHNWQLD